MSFIPANLKVRLQVHNKRARFAKSENNNGKGMLVFPYNEKTARSDGNAKVSRRSFWCKTVGNTLQVLYLTCEIWDSLPTGNLA